MAVYGQGQMLGAGVDPRMFVQDYSGFTRAAEIQAQGMQNLGAMIGKGIADFGEARKERKKIDAEIKATSAGIESAIKMGKDLGIDIESYLAPVQAKINDPNTSPMEALALGRTAAQGISNAFTLGIGAQDRAIKLRESKIDAAYKQANLDIAQQRANIYSKKAQQATASKAAERSLKQIVVQTPLGEAQVDVNVDSQGNPYDIESGKRIGNLQNYATGEGTWEAPEQNLPPTSQINYEQLPSAGNFGFTSKTRDLLPKSTPDARQVSLDFNAAASKDAKGVEIIIPNDASAIERAAAMDYVNQTKQYFADRGVDVPVRGVRTAKENGRGTPGRFHTEPFFVGHAEARKVMESDPDGYARVLVNTLGRIPNVTFIPPHKTNDPGAASGGFNERDFAKNAIIPALERLSRGDLSQQAKGTPEQQAEIARMIQEGAGMATSQMTPSGAMPTEPRMAQSQPQPTPQAQQPRLARGRLIASPAAQKEVQIVKGPEAEKLGLDPMGTYKVQMNPDGSIADAQVMSAPPTAMQKKEAELAEKEAQQQAAILKDKSDQFIQTLEKLRDHPGFSRLFGATWLSPDIGGTAGAGAKTLYKQVEAKGFMEAIKDMKGMGALSDAEGARASIAFNGLDPDMPEEDAKAAIAELIEVIKSGQQRLTGNKLVNPDGTPQTDADKAASEANSYFNRRRNP
jgi:hypothetical protein